MRNRMLVLVLVGICAIAGSGNAHNEWGLANPDFNRPDLYQVSESVTRWGIPGRARI
jgi:hypothetical protein